MRDKEFEPDEIADAAMKVFWRRGYAATSIQDLVDGTGVARSSLYSTFESKHGLYQHALRRYYRVTQANVALLEQPGHAKELIRQLLMRIVNDELAAGEPGGCMAANAALELAGSDNQVARMLAQHFLRLEDALAALLERGQARGEVATRKSARAQARFIQNTIQGMRVLGKGSRARDRRQRLLDIVDVPLDAL